MIYLNRLKTSDDSTFDDWRVTVCTQAIQSLSILASCLVYLRPFLDSLETGFIQIDDLRRQQTSGFGYRPGETPRSPRHLKLGSSFSNLKSKLSRSQSRTDDIENIELQDNFGTSLRNLGNIASSDVQQHTWDMHSRSHTLRTTTLTVERDPSLHIPTPAHFA